MLDLCAFRRVRALHPPPLPELSLAILLRFVLRNGSFLQHLPPDFWHTTWLQRPYDRCSPLSQTSAPSNRQILPSDDEWCVVFLSLLTPVIYQPFKHAHATLLDSIFPLGLLLLLAIKNTTGGLSNHARISNLPNGITRRSKPLVGTSTKYFAIMPRRGFLRQAIRMQRPRSSPPMICTQP